MASGEPFFADPTFWAGASGVAFVVIVAVKGGFKKFGEMLDAKSAEISNQIEEARRLRDEAETMLNESKRRQREVESEVAGLLLQAKEDAKLMQDAAKDEVVRLTERRERLAEQKIAQLETTAIADVRAAAVDAAVGATRKVLAENLAAKDQNALIDTAIDDLENRIH